MKYTILLAFLFTVGTSFGKGPAGGDNSFGVVINGKTFMNGAVVPREDLKDLAGLQLINSKTQKQYKPTEFEWVISMHDEIWKQESNSAENWKRLPGLLEKMDDKSILFIDNMSFNAPGVDFPKTFSFKTQ